MRSSRKVLLTTILFILCFLLISVGTIEVYTMSENSYYQDASERDSLAGTLDFLVIGASHAERSFVPSVMDEELSVNSYNLGGPNLTMRARYDLLATELARNPVKTVVLELTPDAICTDAAKFRLEGDVDYEARIGSFGHRVQYFARAFFPDRYVSAFGALLSNGVECLKRIPKGKFMMEYHSDYRLKGYKMYEEDGPVDQTIDYAAEYKTQVEDTAINEQNAAYLQKMVDLCEASGAEVILAATPMTMAAICERTGYDDVYRWYSDFAETNGLEFYDFSLWKNRAEDFPDDTAFMDYQHLWNDSAVSFTEIFCSTLQDAADGEDISGRFYDSYAALEADQSWYSAVSK